MLIIICYTHFYYLGKIFCCLPITGTALPRILPNNLVGTE